MEKWRLNNRIFFRKLLLTRFPQKTGFSICIIPAMIICTITAFNPAATPQSLPGEMHFSPDGRMLLTGDLEDNGLYDPSEIRTIFLNFSQPGYWELMDSLYWDWAKEEIPATLVMDGITYDSVGVRFKGQSSFQQIPDSPKKSFSISMDFVHNGQDLMGYKSLNLHNGYGDKSFMREVFYENRIKKHIPAAKTAFAKLYINGENWGIYATAQQINKKFYKQWYLSALGTSWRAVRPDGQWAPDGDGKSALNYLGADSALYQEEYYLKFTGKADPWDDLMKTCDVLNNTSLENLPDTLPSVLDIDRALWFLASEILFADDDSYVEKGRVDYFFYWEKETGRLVPQEYDGNGVMNPGNLGWSPFYHEEEENYPLMNRLFKVPEYRQRYLAHLRTLIKEYFNSAYADSIIEAYKTRIDTIVQNDTKKLYTYQEFEDEIDILKDFIANRKNFLENNSEVVETGPVIFDVAWYVSGIPWLAPQAMQNVTVRAKAVSSSGIYRLNVFYSDKLVGNFSKIQMFDDGQHDDLLANDGIYGASLPGKAEGAWVRFYVEATANNMAKSVSYEPPGAEHNVYIYYVGTTSSGTLAERGNNVIIYPNPNKGKFVISPFPGESFYQEDLPGFFNAITIYNIHGEKIYSLPSVNLQSMATIDLSPFPKGVYFLEMNGGKKALREKIVVM